MFYVERVVLWAFKSEESLNACRIAARLFPRAEFYIVILSPSAKARFFLTNLYREVLDVIASEVFDTIGDELRALGIRVARMDRVFGRSPEAIESYARSIRANLVATSISLELGIEDIEHNAVAKLVEVSDIPILMYTPLSKTFERVERIAIVFGAYRAISTTCLSIAKQITSEYRARVTLVGIEKRCRVEEAKELAKRFLDVEVEAMYLGEVSRATIDEIERVTEEHNLVLVDRSSLEPKERIRARRRRLSVAEKVLLTISRAPILFTP